MSGNNTAYINTKGLDLSVTTSSQSGTLPYSGGFLLIKNVGTAEAFVTISQTAVTITASAVTAMSIPAGAIETYRSDVLLGKTINYIGSGATTLRVYPTEGK